jgi:hypothetical protein
MRLSGSQVSRLQEALLQAFPSIPALRELVRLQLNEDLDRIAGGTNTAETVLNLIRWAEATDRPGDLAGAAAKMRPRNPELQALAAELGASEPQSGGQQGSSGTTAGSTQGSASVPPSPQAAVEPFKESPLKPLPDLSAPVHSVTSQEKGNQLGASTVQPNEDNGSNKTKILVAVLGAAAAILVGWWQFGRQSPATFPSELVVRGRVIDAGSEAKVRGAKVVVEAQGLPLVTDTDSEGVFQVRLTKPADQLHVRVAADGYRNYDRQLAPAEVSGLIEIKLQPLKRRAIRPVPAGKYHDSPYQTSTPLPNHQAPPDHRLTLVAKEGAPPAVPVQANPTTEADGARAWAGTKRVCTTEFLSD